MGLFLLNNDANITKKIHSSGLVGQAAIWARNSAVYTPSAPQKLMPLNGLTNEFWGKCRVCGLFSRKLGLFLFFGDGIFGADKCFSLGNDGYFCSKTIENKPSIYLRGTKLKSIFMPYWQHMNGKHKKAAFLASTWRFRGCLRPGSFLKKNVWGIETVFLRFD